MGLILDRGTQRLAKLAAGSLGSVHSFERHFDVLPSHYRRHYHRAHQEIHRRPGKAFIPLPILTNLSGRMMPKIVKPHFSLISTFFGLGVTVAGLTGFFDMAELLAKIPWKSPRGFFKKDQISELEIHLFLIWSAI